MDRGRTPPRRSHDSMVNGLAEDRGTAFFLWSWDHFQDSITIQSSRESEKYKYCAGTARDTMVPRMLFLMLVVAVWLFGSTQAVSAGGPPRADLNQRRMLQTLNTSNVDLLFRDVTRTMVLTEIFEFISDIEEFLGEHLDEPGVLNTKVALTSQVLVEEIPGSGNFNQLNLSIRVTTEVSDEVSEDFDPEVTIARTINQNANDLIRRLKAASSIQTAIYFSRLDSIVADESSAPVSTEEPEVTDSPTSQTAPSSPPSQAPNEKETPIPTNSPSYSPSLSPTIFPSVAPTPSWTDNVSSTPSLIPTDAPSTAPSMQRTVLNSNEPSEFPTLSDSNIPTDASSLLPSSLSSSSPSISGSQSPSTIPTEASPVVPIISDMPSGMLPFIPSVPPTEGEGPTNPLTPVPSTSSSVALSSSPSETHSSFPTGTFSSSPSLSQSPTGHSALSTVPSDSPSPLTSDFPSLVPSSAPSEKQAPQESFQPSFSKTPSSVHPTISIPPTDTPSTSPSISLPVVSGEVVLRFFSLDSLMNPGQMSSFLNGYGLFIEQNVNGLQNVRVTLVEQNFLQASRRKLVRSLQDLGVLETEVSATGSTTIPDLDFSVEMENAVERNTSGLIAILIERTDYTEYFSTIDHIQVGRDGDQGPLDTELPGGAMAGIVIGSVAFVGILAGAAMRRRQEKTRSFQAFTELKGDGVPKDFNPTQLTATNPGVDVGAGSGPGVGATGKQAQPTVAFKAAPIPVVAPDAPDSDDEDKKGGSGADSFTSGAESASVIQLDADNWSQMSENELMSNVTEDNETLKDITGIHRENDGDRKNAITGQTQKIKAPAGQLGLVIDTSVKGAIVHGIKRESPMQNLLFPGDIIVALDDVDMRALSVSILHLFQVYVFPCILNKSVFSNTFQAPAIASLMIKTSSMPRTLTVLRGGTSE